MFVAVISISLNAVKKRKSTFDIKFDGITISDLSIKNKHRYTLNAGFVCTYTERMVFIKFLSIKTIISNNFQNEIVLPTCTFLEDISNVKGFIKKVM